MYKYDCLRCSPESITAFLISYIPIQNKKLLKKKKKLPCSGDTDIENRLMDTVGREEGKCGMYGESNMETYVTICKIDSQWELLHDLENTNWGSVNT